MVDEMNAVMDDMPFRRINQGEIAGGGTGECDLTYRGEPCPRLSDGRYVLTWPKEKPQINRRQLRKRLRRV